MENRNTDVQKHDGFELTLIFTAALKQQAMLCPANNSKPHGSGHNLCAFLLQKSTLVAAH